MLKRLINRNQFSLHVTQVIVFICWINLYVVDTSTKKGFSIGPTTFLCGDFNPLTHVNWWYDWSMNLSKLHQHTNCTVFSPGFVPMIWGWGNHTKHDIDIPKDSEFILGFNEPNHRSQSNLTASEAAKHWKAIEDQSRDLPLVSPAAAPCGSVQKCHGNTTDWFDEFFKLCKNCRVDYLATHAYFKDANKTMEFLVLLWKRYERTIWLTEFAVPHTDSADVQLQYMKEILPQLEEAEYVYRYSWFSNRVTDDTFIKPSASLFKPDTSELTVLGQYYNSFEWRSSSQHESGFVLKLSFDIFK